MSTTRKKKMMGEWSRYNFFLPRIIMLDLYILLINKQSEENRRLRNKVRCACLDDALPHENIGHGWFKTRDGI